MSLDTEILLTDFCLLRLRVLLFGEIKRYKSPIRIRIRILQGQMRVAKLKSAFNLLIIEKYCLSSKLC